MLALRAAIVVLLTALLASAAAGDPGLRVDDAYRLAGKRRTAFDVRAAHMSATEARFLGELFGLGDEAVVLNVEVVRWFASEGAEGLHFASYHARAEDVASRLRGLQGPERVLGLREVFAEAVALQQGFFTDWHTALEEGRPFESQLTSEFGFHAGLYRSHTRILEAYGLLLALFPDEDETNRQAFHDHLRALELGG